MQPSWKRLQQNNPMENRKVSSVCLVGAVWSFYSGSNTNGSLRTTCKGWCSLSSYPGTTNSLKIKLPFIPQEKKTCSLLWAGRTPLSLGSLENESSPDFRCFSLAETALLSEKLEFPFYTPSDYSWQQTKLGWWTLLSLCHAWWHPAHLK